MHKRIDANIQTPVELLAFLQSIEYPYTPEALVWTQGVNVGQMFDIRRQRLVRECLYALDVPGYSLTLKYSDAAAAPFKSPEITAKIEEFAGTVPLGIKPDGKVAMRLDSVTRARFMDVLHNIRESGRQK